MQNVKDSLRELNSLVEQNKLIEAMDKFYDENIIKYENEGPPIKGLKTYKQEVQDFIKSTTSYFAEVKNVIASDDITVTEWHYKFYNKNNGSLDYSQVTLQRWKNGKIIHERHHYKTEIL